MPSELAKKIYQLEWNQIDVIDAELQEVREVLEGLRGNWVLQCWCDAEEDGDHRPSCLRARALWAKLQIGESKSDSGAGEV